ncbi:hypothetical protein E1B28_008398 [Marasmius oreades]|uniref:Uncharacterized protein n=1 Tax=Marasmius oreades TaxID=181124 RepID=A0A9P7URQ5_9AGAR|nr:uncharacterized protein E1B28_008398 [Marasmius oreades]KAG7092012.1 hypothetical protein E1B28_008398 [Marasmius oreades]
MRFLTPSVAKVSTQSHSANQTNKGSLPRHTRRALPRIAEDTIASATSKPGVLATVVARRRIRANETPANAIGRSPSESVLNAPKKPNNTKIGSASDSLGKTNFCDWYKSLTLDKRRALIMSMMAVCKERGDARKVSDHESGSGASRNPNKADLTTSTFQWRVEQSEECLVLQFREWYSSLGEHEQNTALAYSTLSDGEQLDVLTTEDEENETQEISATKGKTVDIKAFGKRLTRGATSQLLSWAESYIEEGQVVVPNLPEAIELQEEIAPDPDYPVVDYPLPTPPTSGYRAKLTRNGTVVLDNWGEVVFEKIPQKYRSTDHRGRKGKARAI